MLVEAQSTWNPNMTLRMLFYLVETYRRYVKDSQQSEHSSARVKLPLPELYIVYSGNKAAPDEISFNDDFFDGKAPIDLKVKILCHTNETIYGQYIGFCKVYDEQRKLYHDRKKCIEETIRICLEKGYLTAFLIAHKWEVVTMMDELFDEQAQREQYNIAERKIYIEKSIEKGIEKGKILGILETLADLVKDGILTITDAAKKAGVTAAEFEALTGLKNA